MHPVINPASRIINYAHLSMHISHGLDSTYCMYEMSWRLIKDQFKQSGCIKFALNETPEKFTSLQIRILISKTQVN